jgi:hypothetical protein
MKGAKRKDVMVERLVLHPGRHTMKDVKRTISLYNGTMSPVHSNTSMHTKLNSIVFKNTVRAVSNLVKVKAVLALNAPLTALFNPCR